MESGSSTLLPPTPPCELTNSAAVDDAISYATSSRLDTAPKYIWVITGPAGCGKTTVAEYLQETMGFTFIEGDMFHTPENISKMSSGQPLTDTDRWDWLIQLREESIRALKASPPGVVVTCSALKRKYRDVFRISPYFDPSINVRFISLDAKVTSLIDRIRSRTNHYMKENMAKTQIESMERKQDNELDILTVDASRTREETQELALTVLKHEMVSTHGIQKA